MFLRVEITTPGQVAQKAKVEGPQITIGRDPACQIPIDGKANSAVSWQHARVEMAAGSATVTDLGSSNGTFVNGVQVAGKKDIQQGDVIGLGQTGPKVRIVELAAAAPPPVHATIAEKLLPHGMLTPPVGNKPLNVSIDTLPPRPASRRRRSPLAGIALGLLAIGAVAAAGVIVFNSQQKTDAKKDDSASEKTKDELAKSDPDKKNAPNDVPDSKTADAGKKEAGNSSIPDVPPPVKIDKELIKIDKEPPQVAKEPVKVELDPFKIAKEPIKPPPPLPAPLTPMTGSEIYRKTLQSTGWVIAQKNSPLGGIVTMTGTGALIDQERRLFLTAYHVIEGATEASVYFPRDDADGRPISLRKYYQEKERPVIGDVIVADTKRDLAILRLRSLPTSVAVLPLAAKGVEPAHRIYTVGNPGASGALWAYTEGTVRQIVQKKFRMNNNQEMDAWIIEAQFPINPGDSGGPVVNGNVELVGVNCSFNAKAQSFSNCVELREVQAVLDQARRNPGPIGTNPGINRAP